jgi:hypothetical protein
MRITLLLFFLMPAITLGFTGKTLLDKCNRIESAPINPTCYGYIHGVLDSAAADGFKICPLKPYYGYLNDTVIQYLKAHPETWPKPASEAVMVALASSFKCRN